MTSIYENPSAVGPNIGFNTGAVSNGQIVYNPYKSNLAGGTNSDWGIIQWNAANFFNPTAPSINDTSRSASGLGTPVASWQSGSGNDAKGYSALDIYQNYNSNYSGYTYSLTQQGGNLSDTFLQTRKDIGNSYTLDKQLTFTANERLRNVSGNTGVLQGYNAMTVNFNADGHVQGVPALGIFLQFNLFDSRGGYYITGGYSTLNGIHSFGSIYAPAQGNNQVDYMNFASSSDFTKVTINVNAAVMKVIDVLSSQDPSRAWAYQNMANWNLSGSYVGIEGVNQGNISNSNAKATLDVNAPIFDYNQGASVSYQAQNNYKMVDMQKFKISDNYTVQANQFTTINNGDIQATSVLSLGGSANIQTSGADYTLSGVFQNLSASSGNFSNANIALNGYANISGTTGTLNVTLTSSRAAMDANNANINMYANNGVYTHWNSGSTTLFGSIDYLTIYGAGDYSNIGVVVNKSGFISNQQGNIGISLGANANLTLDSSTAYVSANSGSVTLNNNAIAMITGFAGGRTFINSNGKFLSYTANGGSNATIDFDAGFGKVQYQANSYTTSIVDFSKGAGVTISNFNPSNGQILATGLNRLDDVQISYINGGALIQEAGKSGSIFVEGVRNGGVSLMTSVGGHDLTSQYGQNTLMIGT